MWHAQPGDVAASQAESELGPYKGPTVRDLVPRLTGLVEGKRNILTGFPHEK
jgi:hypothetical protein